MMTAPPTSRLRSGGQTVCRSIALCLALSAPAAADDPKPDNDKAADARQLAFFESKIRPVLVKHCYECHSAESKEVQGGLLVDTAAGMLSGGDSGPSLVAGKPEQSLLLEALRYDGLEMPPAGRLPEAVVKDFEQWIRMGAPDSRTGGTAAKAPRREIDIEAGRKFWAFQPLKESKIQGRESRDTDSRQTPPSPALDSGRSTLDSPIDVFILSRLQQAGLRPAPDADRRTLVRRLYFDLIGLPPSPQQVEAFVDDTSADALERLVDELLESPQFGMHWGRHWLDVARYADSNGSDFNATFHDAWKYRDYVVAAFNNDKPFDRFIREQIAGDLLPFESDEQQAEQMVATGFLMIGTKMLSERDKDKLQMDVVDEQVSAVGSAFLGLTLGCARCHDHKFDPIPTRDYYALAGIFRSTKTLEGESQQYVSTWTRRPLPAEADHVALVEKHTAEQKRLKGELDGAKKQLKEAESQLAQLKQGTSGLVVDDTDARLVGEWKHSTYIPSFVGKGYIHDDRTGKGEKSVEFPVQVPKTALYDVRLSYTAANGRANNVPVTVKHADGETEVTLDETKPPPIDRLFASVGTFRFEAKAPASVTVSNRGTVEHVIADALQLVEVDAAGKPVVSQASPDEERVRQATAKIEEFKATVARLEEQQKQLDANAPPPLPFAFAVDEFKDIGDCEICIRGEHKNRGEKVPRGFLQVAMTGELPTIGQNESGRRQLADWIASPDNPLTPRVIVNRIWYYLLGEGIVPSIDNFGELGDRPTHPELLDRLALDFIRDGWSIKRAVRRIVLSRTYRMSSAHDEANWKIDPENVLLWRSHRRRLPAEALRDALLVVSDQLDRSPGGTPVPGLGVLVTTNDANAKDYDVQQSPRRSLYLPIIRSELPAILTAFDFADPDFVTGRRPVTNVPAQALLLMNSPFVMEASDRTAARLLAQHAGTDRELAEAAYRLVLSRIPTEAEAERAADFLSHAQHASAEKRREIDPRRDALAQLVHILFASTEFRMLD